eukprot:m.57600 g.57600  ORF g.57600 m.57600 type:complete len:374 (-) comp11610_c0_seq2:261-1382(-)
MFPITNHLVRQLSRQARFGLRFAHRAVNRAGTTPVRRSCARVVGHQTRRWMATTSPKPPPPPSPGGTQEGPSLLSSTAWVVSDVLMYTPTRFLAGLAIGGLGATIGGVLYFAHMQDPELIGDLLSSLADGKKHESWSDLVHTVPIPIVTLLGWIVFGGATLLVTVARGRLRLQLREFMRTVNVSLTSISSDGTLKLRTLLECPVNHIVSDNPAAISIIRSAARKTTAANPIIPLPSHHHELIYSHFLNAISPLFANGFVADALKMPVKRETMYFAVTFRSSTAILGGDRRMQKIRVVVVSETDLEAAVSGMVPKLEHPSHSARWNTLKLIKSYVDNGCVAFGEAPCPSGDTVHRLGKFEVVVPELAARVQQQS